MIRPDTSKPADGRMDFAASLGADGIVLLDNRGGILPLTPGSGVVLLGISAYFGVRMGWGSGDKPFSRPVSCVEGLKAEGVAIARSFDGFYSGNLLAVRRKFARLNCDWWKWTERIPEPSMPDAVFDALAAEVSRDATAVVVVGRMSGESADRKDRGGSFRLHREEERLVRLACRRFEKVAVVLNACGAMDVSFMDRHRVGALLYAPLLGEASGVSIARVLSGTVNPSGRTVDTWAAYRDCPARRYFGSFEVPYSEGLLVGYRYFCDRPDKVRYPFGHGLSYTGFSVAPRGGSLDGTVVRVSADVENTGRRAGRHVVQAYLSRSGRCPQTEPAAVLCAFAKTREIAPGACVNVDLSFDLRGFASYDAGCGAWKVPADAWTVSIGDTAASLREAFRFETEEIDATAYRAPGAVERAARPFAEQTAGGARIQDPEASLDDRELAQIVNGFPAGDRAWAGGASGGAVEGEAAEIRLPPRFGCAPVVLADGPAGVRLAPFGSDRPSAAAMEMFQWPSETAIAQTWDLSAAVKFGRMLSRDMEKAGVDVILAPGVNIHRNPLCGRLFEYFSEDPLLAGEMAAAVVRGVQTRDDGSPSGRYAVVKHFCCNNQESHRRETVSAVDERTLREIYLRPFEIAVAKSSPFAVMTSYNRVGEKWPAADRRLVDGILRGEWGFGGIVMTDWWCVSDKLEHPQAGNDLVMPGVPDEIDDLYEAVVRGKVRREDLRKCAARIIRAVAAVTSRGWSVPLRRNEEIMREVAKVPSRGSAKGGL